MRKVTVDQYGVVVKVEKPERPSNGGRNLKTHEVMFTFDDDRFNSYLTIQVKVNEDEDEVEKAYEHAESVLKIEASKLTYFHAEELD